MCAQALAVSSPRPTITLVYQAHHRFAGHGLEKEDGMNTSVTGTLAIELQLHSSTQWVATYYPMVETPAGRWAEVTWPLHQCLTPITAESGEPARWLEARSSDPYHPCYANHRAWSQSLAAGYATALAVYDSETVEEPLSHQGAQQLQHGTIVIPVGQLPEWMLDDLRNETSRTRSDTQLTVAAACVDDI